MLSNYLVKTMNSSITKKTCSLGSTAVVTFESYKDFCKFIAQITVQCLDNHSLLSPARRFNIGLPTGGTPIGIYSELTQILSHAQKQKLNCFGLDEYLDVGFSQSYYYFLCQHFYEPNEIALSYRHRPEQYVKYEGQYDEVIKTCDGLDLVLLGLGDNGHIAFNEPGSVASSVTRVIELSGVTRAANSRFFNSLDSVPFSAATMGIATIFEAKKIILAVHGESKRQALIDAFTGPMSPGNPASFLQLHSDVEIFTDFAL
jgi:glucosamine-6-phosphate deaminase